MARKWIPCPDEGIVIVNGQLALLTLEGQGKLELTGLSEKDLDEMIEKRAQEIVRLAFERSKEGFE